MITKYDSERGVIYCDPPYLGSTRTSMRDGKRPGGDYHHEMHTDDEHKALAEVLHRCKAHVFISGYDSPLYHELYDGWSTCEWQVLCRVSNGMGNGGAKTTNKYRTEVLWSNRPIVQHGRLDFPDFDDADLEVDET